MIVDGRIARLQLDGLFQFARGVVVAGHAVIGPAEQGR